MQVLAEHTTSYAGDALGAALAAVAFLSLAVGVWVVVREEARRVSLTLLAGAVAVAVYLTGFSFMARAPSAVQGLLWAKVAYVGVPFIVPALYHFCMELLGLHRQRQRLITAAWVIGLVYAVLAVGTDVLMEGVDRASWGYYTDLTPWNVPFVVWSAILLVLATRDFWSAYQHADRVQKARIRWLAIPMVIASVAFIDYGPSFGLDWPPVGFVFFSVFMLSAAWVVARYHLPDLTPAFAAEQILSTMAEPLLVVDESGRVSITNPAATRLLGWSEAELRDRTLGTVLGLETAERLVAEATCQGEEMEFEARTGEPIAVSVSTNHLIVKGRRRGTVIVARDIRERKRAARQLERREEYFRALIERAPSTITVLEPDGTVRYQSPSHQEILGRRPQETLGQGAFDRVHPDDQEEMRQALAALARAPVGATARAEARILHSDGEYRVLDLRAQNLLDHPAVGGIVVHGRDITEERRLAEELQRSQRLEAVGRLAGGIAHDFNNILTTIQGAASLMDEEVPEGSELESELAVIREGTERAGRLTRELLAFGRRQVTRPEVLNPAHMVQDLASGFQQILRDGQRLEIEADEEADDVRVDRGQIEDALVNLVLNARDAMDDDGRLGIAVENRHLDGGQTAETPIEPGPYVCIRVVDDGHGMDGDTLQRVFDPFFTPEEEGVGDGLGLASVYGAVRQAGGHIEVESEPGEGTTFSIYLPRADGRRDAAGSGAAETGTASGEGGPLPGDGPDSATVLVVEDEAPVRNLITKVLERSGYTVVATEDGETALQAAADHPDPIALLIADLVMPGMTGREVAERLGERYQEMATILISGYTADEVVRDGISRGEYVFIPKPFSPETLIERVADVLREPRPAM